MTTEKADPKRPRDAGEPKFNDLVNEFLTNPKFAETLGSAIQRAAGAKRKADQGLRLAMNLVNVPTKADYDDLVRKVAKLGDSVARLETRLETIQGKLERLAAKMKK